MKSYNNTHREIRIGDVYLMKFDGTGSEQKGLRPCLIFQNNLGNKYSPNLIVLPLTSSIKKVNQPTHVFVPSIKTGLAKDSIILCENPRCVSKDKLGSYLTTIPDEYMGKIAEAYLIATSAISFINPEIIVSLWQKAVMINAC